MHLGTLLVLIGTIIFGIALLFGYTGEPRGRLFSVGSLVALAGLLVGIGVLLGAPAIATVH